MLEPLCGSFICVNASVLPSGDHDSGLCMLPIFVSSSGSLLRSAGIHHIVIVPVFQERNVSRRPSGVHDGQWLAPSKLIFVGSPPRAKSYVKMSCDAPSTSMASRRPSGESLGWRYACGFTGSGCLWPSLSTHTGRRVPCSTGPAAYTRWPADEIENAAMPVFALMKRPLATGNGCPV